MLATMNTSKVYNMDYRSLVESLDNIMHGEEGSDELSPQELLKGIVQSLQGITNCISAEEIQDYDALKEVLKDVKNMLDEVQDTQYNEPHQDETVEEDLLPLDSIEGNELGTKGMGPTIDSAGKQNYAKKDGKSYAERKGFVGP